jgi:hypothetical protein
MVAQAGPDRMVDMVGDPAVDTGRAAQRPGELERAGGGRGDREGDRQGRCEHRQELPTTRQMLPAPARIS